MMDKFVWRVKTLDMDTPGVLVAGSEGSKDKRSVYINLQ